MKKSRISRRHRRSSPSGIAERMARRLQGYLAVPQDLQGGFRRPGSENPRKVSR